MGMLKSIFGPSKEEIWSQIARDIGGEFIDGGFWGKDALVYRHGQWQVVLDTYTVTNSTGSSTTSTTYTRMRAPFINKDGFHFELYREGFFSSLGKLFGMQDIQIGDPFFDKDFIIKSSDPEKIRTLLSDTRMKGLIQRQPQLRYKIKDDEGWFGASFPEGVDELYFECVGVIKDTALLEALFVLFSLTLERLVQMDSAYANDPMVTLK